MATTRLLLYNAAMLDIGERQLSSLTENREPRRVLDIVWDTGAVDFVLEQGLWNFAMRTVEIEYAPSITPAFGYARGFDKPTDWVRTAALCSDESFNVPLTQFVDEAGYWFAHLDALYVKYVSNDASYGADLSLWPQSFVKYAAAYLAHAAALRLTQSEEKVKKIERQMQRALIDARSKDAMNEPTMFLPRGSWLRARRGGGGGDRGNSGSLIG